MNMELVTHAIYLGIGVLIASGIAYLWLVW